LVSIHYRYMKKINCIRVYADEQQIESCRTKLQDADHSIQLLSRSFSLAGNQMRLNILYLLWDQDKLCVCDLSDILGISIPGVSQHLRKMKDNGMVTSNKVAQTIFYSLTPEHRELFSSFFKMMAKNKVFETV